MWWADRYGWTPSQVDDLPAQLAWQMRQVAMATDAGLQDARLQAERDALRAAQRGR